MNAADIEALLDEFGVEYGRLTRFNNGNCLLSLFTRDTADNVCRALRTIGFNDVQVDEGVTHAWFTTNGRTVLENMNGAG